MAFLIMYTPPPNYADSIGYYDDCNKCRHNLPLKQKSLRAKTVSKFLVKMARCV